MKRENKIKSSQLDLDGCKKNNFTKKENNGNDGNEDNNNDELNIPKFSETKFEKLFYDEKSNTSVVICKPKTGRTHQIRIHLKYLGFPIANDPCYGGIVFNGIKELDNPEMKEYLFREKKDDKEKEEDEKKEKEEKKNENEHNINNNNNIIDNNLNLSVSEIYCYKIWLHAWTYKFENYEFKTSIPDWATKEFNPNHIFK